MKEDLTQTNCLGGTIGFVDNESKHLCAVADHAQLVAAAESISLKSRARFGAARTISVEGSLGILALTLTPLTLLSAIVGLSLTSSLYSGVMVQTIVLPMALAVAVVSLHVLIAMGKRLRSGLSIRPETWLDLFPTSVVIIEELNCSADEAFARCIGGLCRNVFSQRSLNLDLQGRRITGKIFSQAFEINLQEQTNGKSVIMMHVAHGRGGGLNALAAIDFGLVELLTKRFLEDVRSSHGRVRC